MKQNLLRALAIWLAVAPLHAQVCRLSVAGLNRNRRVTGPISAECPDPLHSAPFGNWGVTSNFGGKLNGHQFDGWCHDVRVCDNSGTCFNVCRDGWYEWNSCTTNARFTAPNCNLYNSAECSEQVTTTGVNVLGTQTVDVPVSCPSASGSAAYDKGGCGDVPVYSRSNNFMSLYELDPITGDELVQSVYYPSILVETKCNAWGCPPAGSDWVNPVAWDSPASPPKVFAEMAMVVNSGAFVDSGNSCRITPIGLQVVSSATLQGPAVAPDSIATLFTGDVTALTESAAAQPLPTVLSGIQVRIVDSGNTARNAALAFAGPRQVNLVVPAGLREGTATVSILAGNMVRSTGAVQVARVQPGLYTANASGQGTAAAVGIRVEPNGTQISQTAFECLTGGCEAVPLDLGGSSEQFVLVLFGTGIRGRLNLESVQAVVGGVPVPVQYAGPQPTFAGLDQVNLLLPKTLAGRGFVEVNVTVEGKAANPVSVWLR